MRRHVGTLLVSFLIAAGALGCGEGAISGSAGGTAMGGSGTGGNGTGATMTITTSTSITTTPSTTTTASTGGAGGAASDCDPAAPADSLFALSDTDLDENVISMCKYRGDVLLIVNVAEA